MKTNKSRRGSFGSSEAEGDRVQDRLQGDRRREDPRSAQNAGTGAVSQKAEHAEPGWEGGSRKGGPNPQMRCAPTSTTHVENRSVTGNCIETNLEDQVHTGKSKCHLLPSSDGDLLNKQRHYIIAKIFYFISCHAFIQMKGKRLHCTRK